MLSQPIKNKLAMEQVALLHHVGFCGTQSANVSIAPKAAQWKPLPHSCRNSWSLKCSEALESPESAKPCGNNSGNGKYLLSCGSMPQPGTGKPCINRCSTGKTSRSVAISYNHDCRNNVGGQALRLEAAPCFQFLARLGVCWQSMMRTSSDGSAASDARSWRTCAKYCNQRCPKLPLPNGRNTSELTAIVVEGPAWSLV